MKWLVVNADDFGLTEGINRAVLEAHRRGILTSATLLANGVAFDSAVAMAQNLPRLGLGIHLNLTEGPPVSDPSAAPSLVNEAGHFSGGPIRFAQRVLSGKVRLVEVERELAAQIKKVRGAGVPVTHLDSHQHVHMLPAIFSIVTQLARQFRIPAVRWAVEWPMPLGAIVRGNGSFVPVLSQYLKGRALALMAIASRRQLEQAGLVYPMYFHGITQTGSLNGAQLEAILLNLPEGTSELMCHPGYMDSELMHMRLAEQRERELGALTCSRISRFVARLGIRLINYRELATR